MRQVLLGFAILTLAGCATFGPGDLPPAGPQIETPQLPPLAIRDHKRVVDSFGGEIDLPALTKIANEVFARLAPVSDRPDLRYRLTVLNSPQINAFALPSGQIYITRGMLALINDTAELAAVLGHEMAHVFADHATMREERAKTDEIVAAFRQTILNDPAGAEQRRAMGRLSLAHFSREQELIADKESISLLFRAGFDPRAALRVLTALDRFTKLNGDTALGEMASHPLTADRIQQATIAARALAGPDMGEKARDGFLRSIDGLMFGEDGKNGLVEGETYSHPRLGFTFNAPKGFTLDNHKAAIVGAGPNESGFRLDAVALKVGQKLDDYIRSGWLEGLVEPSVQIISVNGLNAATAIARGPEWSFRVYVIEHDQKAYRLIYATKQLDAASDEAFQLSMGSFRLLSTQEVRALEPYRLKIVTAGGENRLEAKADELKRLPHALDVLRILNGLNAMEEPHSGSLLKILAVR